MDLKNISFSKANIYNFNLGKIIYNYYINVIIIIYFVVFFYEGLFNLLYLLSGENFYRPDLFSYKTLLSNNNKNIFLVVIYIISGLLTFEKNLYPKSLKWYHLIFIGCISIFNIIQWICLIIRVYYNNNFFHQQSLIISLMPSLIIGLLSKISKGNIIE